jgi:F-type H+-transporting ATPase subunit gamma
MKRAQFLQRRLHAQETLYEAVSALKSLSAHHFRTARTVLPATHAYRAGVEAALAAIDLESRALSIAPPALLLIASDLGLCHGYNARLGQYAVTQYAHLQCATIYCVGRRPVPFLERAHIAITRVYPAPASVAGLTRLLLHLAQDMLGEHLDGTFSSLYAVSARFDGVGAFTPVCTPVWPLQPERQSSPLRPSVYVSRRRLLTVARREFLYIVLFQILLDALAAEHSTRLVATSAAAEWLQSRIADTRRQLATSRRETSTQELLDIVSGMLRREGTADASCGRCLLAERAAPRRAWRG